jgi:hypothetical protein
VICRATCHRQVANATGISGKQPSMVQGAGAVSHDRPFEAARDTTGIA